MAPMLDLNSIRFTVLLAQVAVGLLQFDANPNLTMPAYVAARNLGAPVGDYTVSGLLYIVTDDSCNRDPAEYPDLSGRVVFLVRELTCPWFRPYDLFAARNATAIIRNMTRQAGKTYPMWSLHDRRERVEGARTAPLYVDMNWDPTATGANRTLFQDGVRVRVRADMSPWEAVFRSWWFQLGCRWLTAFLYGVAFVLSGTFLVQHGLLIRDRNRESNKSGLRLLSHTLSQITLIHLALFMAALKNGVLMVGAVLGGYLSEPFLPYEILVFLGTGLNGIESSVLIITARYWHQVISKSDLSTSSRAWSGAVAVVLSVFAIALDSFVGFMLASYHTTDYTALTLMVLLFTVVTFVYFACSLTRFQLQLRRNQKKGTDGRLSEFIRRLSVRASWLTASLLAHMVGVTIYGSNTRFQSEPALFGRLFVVQLTVRTLRSTFSVWMLQPRKNVSSRASVQATAKQRSVPSGESASRKPAPRSSMATTTPTNQPRLSGETLLPSRA